MTDQSTIRLHALNMQPPPKVKHLTVEPGSLTLIDTAVGTANEPPDPGRWRRIRSWRPSPREWLLLVPAMVWTIAILAVFLAPYQFGIAGGMVAVLTSVLLGVLCSQHAARQEASEVERKVLLDMVGVAYARIDRLENELHQRAQ